MATSYKVITEFPIAFDSEDFLVPGGTMHDSSRNHRFNELLYELTGHKPLRILDLGCAGGGFVADCLKDGHEAIGLEGSDYSTKWDGPGGTDAERAVRKPGKRAEWANIPDNLFTCDITRPFTVIDIDHILIDDQDGGRGYAICQFDVISAWEVMEHLPADRLPTLCDNVKRHLAKGGMWIMSVSLQHGDYHQTVKPPHWWLELFKSQGLVNDPAAVSYFGDQWIRGPLQNAPESFHLILRRE